MKENRVWIRIINSCNSKCKFCLDHSSQEFSSKISFNITKNKIKNQYKIGFFNKIIISGGEASTHEKFFDCINFAKKVGYNKIQTITNGNMFGNFNFCKESVDAGLDEITFSIHGHDSETHDKQTGIKGSFKNIIKSIIIFKKNFPSIIVNSDIVVSKVNIKIIPKIIQLLKKLDVFEYDILQVIPFGRAWIYKDEYLFDNINNYYSDFQNIRKESNDNRVNMYANRVFPYLLEGYESLIQNPTKIINDLSNESRETNESAFNKRLPFYCFDSLRCENCYNQVFCKELLNTYNLEKEKYKSNILPDEHKFYSSRDLDKIKLLYPKSINDFVKLIKGLGNKNNRLINVPYCIFNKNNYFSNYFDKYNTLNFDDYLTRFVDEGFRIKSQKCNQCKFNNNCKGIHINIIKLYGFNLYNPI